MAPFRTGHIGGRLPLDPSAPRPDLTRHMSQPSMGDAPDSIDYYSKVASWGMLANNVLGDCTCACDGHIAIQQTCYGIGKADQVTDSEVVVAYSAVGGYIPGDPDTDRGATIQAALEYLRRTGIAGFRISAYGHLDPRDHVAVKRAIEDFGALSIGMNLPQVADEQFANGLPFDVTDNDGQSLGGHCMMAAGYDAQFVYVVTWGDVRRMTWAFWDRYVDEAWAVISEDWTSVTGLTLEQFGAEFAQAFAARNPFAPPLIKRIEIALDNDIKGADKAFLNWFRKRAYRGMHS